MPNQSQRAVRVRGGSCQSVPFHTIGFSNFSARAAWGEEVAAAVTLKGDATEAELLAYCKERLADFKRPKQIHITTAIPRTATGKIQRRVVAQAFAQQPS